MCVPGQILGLVPPTPSLKPSLQVHEHIWYKLKSTARAKPWLICGIGNIISDVNMLVVNNKSCCCSFVFMTFPLGVRGLFASDFKGMPKSTCAASSAFGKAWHYCLRHGEQNNPTGCQNQPRKQWHGRSHKDRVDISNKHIHNIYNIVPSSVT